MNKVFVDVGISLDGFMAGLIDEFTLHIAPIILGKGVRPFENINKEIFSVEISNVVNSPIVTHLYYKIKNLS